MELKSGLLGTHYCQKTQILVKFGSQYLTFEESKQQKVKNISHFY